MAPQNNSEDLCGNREREGENNRLLRLLLFLCTNCVHKQFCLSGSGGHSLALIVLKVVSQSEQARCSFKKSAMNQKAVAACV